MREATPIDPHLFKNKRTLNSKRKGRQILATLEERLRFEEFISDFSAKFINLPSEQMDAWIEQGLKQVVEFLDIDRSSLLQFSETKDELKIVYTYARPGLEPLIKLMKVDDLFPWATPKALLGNVISFSSLDEFPPEAKTDRNSFAAMNLKSNINMPLSIGGSVEYILSVGALREERKWPPELFPRLQLIGEILINALDRKEREEKLHIAFEEIRQLKKQMETENLYLREAVATEFTHDEIVGHSPAIQRVLAQIQQVAPTDSSVLIEGETGVGKELIARAIHNHSSRKKRIMVTVSCSTLPASLIESELFGREIGAYTGALSKQVGRFEIADGSTIFLDEIGELSPELQNKLLRVLQEGEFERLGSPKKIKVNVRVIAATNRDLAEEVRKGSFRKDLYYRLRVFPIHAPPLRERLEDIPNLVEVFVDEFRKKMGKKIKTVSRKSLETLQRYSWPGNIRELRNIVEYAVIISSGSTLNIPLPEEPAESDSLPQTLEGMEKTHILKVLKETNWRIKGRHGAAKILGLNPSTLYFKMKKMNIPTREDKIV
jgi:formate hydrogenlyase transcriptional activator